MTAQKYKALVLNADFTPLSVAPLSYWDFERTLRNVLKGRVIVLEEYDEVLRSANNEYKPPSVVALKKYIAQPKRVPFNRINIFTRDNFTCQYCDKQFPSSELSFDHVIPKSKGGKTNFSNIVTACVKCNRDKADTYKKPLREPYIPDYYSMPKIAPDTHNLHHSWLDYLYWSGVLQQS